jgi:O-antigen/teichoic acid export membrane protein
MALFLGVSLGAMRNFDFIPPLPGNVREMLGAPPPVTLISTALVVYSFSAIILILSRMTLNSGKYGGITHVGYLSAFYGFYHYARALGDNFWAVFAAGVTVLALESYHVWTYYRGLIREEEEKLSILEARLKRTSGL